MRPCNAPHYKGPGPAICNAYARPPPRHSTLIVPFCHFAGHVCAAGLEARPSSHHRFSPQISSHLEISCVLGIPPRILPPSVALILICFTQFSLIIRLAGYKYRMSHIIYCLSLSFYSHLYRCLLPVVKISRLHLVQASLSLFPMGVYEP